MQQPVISARAVATPGGRLPRVYQVCVLNAIGAHDGRMHTRHIYNAITAISLEKSVVRVEIAFKEGRRSVETERFFAFP